MGVAAVTGMIFRRGRGMIVESWGLESATLKRAVVVGHQSRVHAQQENSSVAGALVSR